MRFAKYLQKKHDGSRTILGHQSQKWPKIIPPFLQAIDHSDGMSDGMSDKKI